MKKQKIYKSGTVFLLTGVLLGFLLVSFIVWGDMESALFTSGIKAESSLKGLRCPVLITTQETSQIFILVNNPGKEVMKRYIQSYTSKGLVTVVRKNKQVIEIKPGENKRISVDIYPEDAAFDRIILFRAFVHKDYPYPSMSGNCGVVVVNLPRFNGKQILFFSIGLTLASMIIGGIFMIVGDTKTTHHFYYRTRNVLIVLSCLINCGLYIRLH